ncbi:MAG: hypothetical protein HYZ13_10175 [Acidobacteria bacterium]|nr:hypothetical protein [Acidobacteriota bacterium]
MGLLFPPIQNQAEATSFFGVHALVNSRFLALTLLSVHLVSGDKPKGHFEIFPHRVVSKGGVDLLNQGSWFALMSTSNGFELISGSPRFRPAGSMSPHEEDFQVLPPRGAKGKLRFWFRGADLRPGKIPTGVIERVKTRLPARMVAKFGKDPITISCNKKPDGSYSLSAIRHGISTHLLHEANQDPSNNGWRIAWVGDLNCDGLPDLVIELEQYMALETVLLVGQRSGGFTVEDHVREDWD